MEGGRNFYFMISDGRGDYYYIVSGRGEKLLLFCYVLFTKDSSSEDFYWLEDR